MSDITVRVLGGDDWEAYRAVRLRALKESPEAFVASAQEESEYGEDRWRSRMERSTRLLASDGDDVIGVASVGSSAMVRYEEDGDSEEVDGVGELFGLWVQPSYRGAGVARKLLESAVTAAQDQGLTHLVYWVGSDNGRGVAFASSFGFRPTDERRPMEIRGVDDEEDSEEVALVLALGRDASTGPIPIRH